MVDALDSPPDFVEEDLSELSPEEVLLGCDGDEDGDEDKDGGVFDFPL